MDGSRKFFVRKKAIKKCASLILLIALSCMQFVVQAQSEPRVINLNKSWLFSTENKGLVVAASEKWTPVNLPHTWNADDVNDDTPGYLRAACWYKKLIPIDDSYKGKSIYLSFDGANQTTEVYVNGKLAGKHTGGYTAFHVKIDPYLNFTKGTENLLLVKVDNSHNENIPPLSGDFTFYGGIYRDVNLVINNQTHFSYTNGANGIFISTPIVTAETASLQVKSVIENDGKAERKLELVNELRDADGNVLKKTISTIKIKSGIRSENLQLISSIRQPILWSPENPYLYTLFTIIKDSKTGEVLDRRSNSVGFRWFKFDAKLGFFLNGKPLKLVGASRHQDFKGLGNALSHPMHWNDVKALKEMGGNFLRVAHYPQDQAVLEACNRLGILASVEIPVVNAITETEEFTSNCKLMQQEMIQQNFNHPSIILWGYMNEVFLRPKFGDDPERQKVYFNNITKLAEQLEALTRQEDPGRYTMMANHGDYNRYKQYRLIDIPMVVGWNLYQGWYSGSMAGFGDFLDKHHKEFPEKPLMVTEYGADADPRIHSFNPERFDKSLEYSLMFHQSYFKAIKDRPFVAAAMVWNLADFNSETREETMPHINNKGLLSFNRQPKDLYSFYQSQLSASPYVKISNWRNRSGLADSLGYTSTQALMVFSNTAVKMYLNGEEMGKASVSENVHTWFLPFKDGMNRVRAVSNVNGKEYTDVAVINMGIISRNLNKTENGLSLNILLGAKRIYTNELTGEIWLPSQAYRAGSWGHIGGQPYKQPGNSRQSYGTDRNIKDTENDPIYQSQQVGIEKFKLDVPDGDYQLNLHFAELTTSDAKEALAYNLDNTVNKTKAESRVFGIAINGTTFIKNYNIAERYNTLTAASEMTRVIVMDGKGIEIVFSPITGSPVLNALQLKKIH